MGIAGKSTIVLCRSNLWTNRYRKFKVLIDGRKEGAIASGQSESYTVTPGRHNIQVRLDWYKSEPLELDLVEGEEVRLECGPRTGISAELNAIVSPGGALYVKAADETVSGSQEGVWSKIVTLADQKLAEYSDAHTSEHQLETRRTGIHLFISYRREDSPDVCGRIYDRLIQQFGKEAVFKDIDSIPWPAYELFPMEQYRLLRMPHCTHSDFVMPMLSGRGCTFTCNFCYRMDKGFRPRSPESIVEEILYLKKEFNISYIAFSDELLMSSKQRTIEICESFLKANLNIKWDCNGRLNYATPEVLSVMKKAGCVFINYGIEAFDNDVLKKMQKALTINQINKGIEATLAAGISPGLNMLFGHIGDTRDSLNSAVDFLIKHDDGAQMRTIRPVTPYPGSPLYNYAIEKGLIKDIRDFYENKHLNSDLFAANFTELSEEELYSELSKANIRLMENYFENKKKLMVEQTQHLYSTRDASFRGFRQA